MRVLVQNKVARFYGSRCIKFINSLYSPRSKFVRPWCGDSTVCWPYDFESWPFNGV